MAETASLEEEERAAPPEAAGEEREEATGQTITGAATATAAPEPRPEETPALQSTIGNAALARVSAGQVAGAPSAPETPPPAPAPAPEAAPAPIKGEAAKGGAAAGARTPAVRGGGAPAPPAPAPPPSIPTRHYDFSLPPAFLSPARLSVPRAMARSAAYDPEAARLEARTLVSTLRSTGARLDGAISSAAEARKQDITAAANLTRSALVKDIRKVLASACAEVASAKATVAAIEARRAAEATKVIGTGPIRIAAETATGLAAVDAMTKDRIEQAHVTVATGQTRARELGRNEGARGKAQIDSQAAEAWNRGRAKAAGYPADDRGEVQAEAVLRVAAETAKKLAEPGPELQEKLEDAGDDLADGFDDGDEKIVETIEAQSQSLKETIVAQGATLTPHLDQVSVAVMTGMVDVTGQASVSLTEVETAAVGELTELETATVAQLDGALEFALELIDAETRAVLDATGNLVGATARTVEALENPSLGPVRETIDATDSAHRMAAESFADAVKDIGDVVDDAFDGGRAAVADGTAEAGAAVSSGLNEAVGKVDEGLGLVVSKAEEGVERLVTEWRDAITVAMTDTDKEYEKAVAGVQAKIDESTEKVKVEMAANVTAAVTKNREGLDQLDGQMEKAAAEAREKYDAPWYEKLGRWLLHALLGLLKALVALLVLIVVAVLAIVLIIVGIVEGLVVLIVIGLVLLAAVLVYAVYSIVKGIVNRVMSAKTWWQGIWGFIVGVLDIVGLPNLVEGLIGRDIVNWRRLTTEDAGERFGGGLLNAILWFLPLKLKGAKVKAPLELPPPTEFVPPPTEFVPPAELRIGPELPPEVPPPGGVPPAIEIAPKPLETAPKPLETVPNPLDTAPKPLETSPKPLETTPQPLETTPQPLETTPRPVETAPKPVEEAPKPVETKPPPVETPPTPVETAPKPVETAPKPAETAPKPVEEVPKPAEEAPKPVEEAPKPVEEAPKPAEEAPKPAEEAPKPAEEAPEKPVEEQPSPTEQALEQLREQKKINESKIADLQRRIDALSRKIKDILERRTRERGDVRKQLGEQAKKLDRDRAKLEKEKQDIGRENRPIEKEIGRLERKLNPDKRVELPCFAPDTLVWTASGTVRIDSLAPGDTVLAHDTERDETVERRVEAVLVNSTTRFHEIDVAGTTIHATGDHRFWLESGSEWVAARDLAAGMPLRLADGSSAPIERRRLGTPGDYPTFNLRIDTTPTYFVGPGALVHNDGPVNYSYGGYSVYEGLNTEFPGKVYIGLSDDVPGREIEHRQLAERMLKLKLDPKQRAFFEFMKGVRLRPRATGLSKPQAEYLEQINITIEANEGRAVNRKLEQVSPSRMQKLKLQIAKALGKCPP